MCIRMSAVGLGSRGAGGGDLSEHGLKAGKSESLYKPWQPQASVLATVASPQ